MDIKPLKIQNFKKIEKKFLEKFKNNIIWSWSIIGFALLFYAIYIFYSKTLIPLTTPASSTIQPLTVQKNQLNQILEDLNQREQKRNEFSAEKIINPFEFRQ